MLHYVKCQLVEPKIQLSVKKFILAAFKKVEVNVIKPFTALRDRYTYASDEALKRA